jgi:hypothetical protein
MGATLAEALLMPEVRPQVIADCQALIVQEISGMSGISVTAVKLAYKTVNVFSASHVHHMIEVLLPEMAEQLQPYWTDFSASDDGDFGAYLVRHGDEVSQALLSVTDARGAASSRPVITKAYGAVRDRAGKHVTAALPNVGALVQKYVT